MNVIYFLLGNPYFPGPGSYYVVILIQFILLFPLIYKLFEINPIFGFICCYLIELSFQLFTRQVPIVRELFDDYTYLYSANIFRYFSIIGFGLYFINNSNLFSKKNLFIWPLLFISLYSLMGCGIFWGNSILPDWMYPNLLFESEGGLFYIKYFYRKPWWGIANLINYPFDAFIFLLCMMILPSELNKDKPRHQSISRFFKKYSKLTYHILLVQIVYFFINIPIIYGVSIGINGSLFDVFIQPFVDPYGITAPWEDFSVVSFNIAILIILTRIFVIFLNCAVTFTLAKIFYNVDIGIQRNLKYIRKPNVKKI